jgi:hypothetical protein
MMRPRRRPAMLPAHLLPVRNQKNESDSDRRALLYAWSAL